MSTRTSPPPSWSDLTITDLFYAYRKAKADCFFERSVCVSQQFVEYEQSLPRNLSELLNQLQAGNIDTLLNASVGDPRLVAKKLAVGPLAKGVKVQEGHGYYSDATRAFRRLRETSTLIPEFRLSGDFPVQMHVLSALWINLVGHKFDAALPSSAYGSRLRRYRPDPGTSNSTLGNYHLEAVGSFQPYFGPYKKWRQGGMQAIRDELKADRQVIAMSMDLTSYYHQIDPAFLADARFYKYLGIELSDWEKEFTTAFANALSAWSDRAVVRLQKLGCNADDVQVGGLPIGLTIARVAANVLLSELDRDIEQGLAPVYYGRYVDDLFLVLRDPGTIGAPDQLLKFIAARTKCFPRTISKGEIKLRLSGGYQGKTNLLLQQKKQKAFFLQGRAGIDLLDNIETQIRSVSSERRLMPSPDRLESMASAKVLTAAGHPSEEADTLRRADGLAVRRLGWSIQLRAVEILARDLRKNDWKEERSNFYEFAHSHILRPDKVLDHVDYLPRLLSLAVALADWPNARKLVDATRAALAALQRDSGQSSVRINGIAASNSDGVWTELDSTVLALARDAVLRSIPWRSKVGLPMALNDTATSLCELIGIGADPEVVHGLALAFREADWAKVPYKDHLQRDASQQRRPVESEELLHGVYDHETDLIQFLKESHDIRKFSGALRVNPRAGQPTDSSSLLPYLFPTRPYTTEEISLFLPERCVFSGNELDPARAWARYVRAVRGVWVWGRLVSDGQEDRDPFEEYASEQGGHPEKRFAYLGSARKDEPIRLGVSSLLTTEETWRLGASGRIDLSRKRYERIERIVNQAIRSHPKPTHLLLPELSLPDRWVRTVSGLLREAGISLIAGLDYQHSHPNEIYSEAVLVLEDDRLGFPASVQIRQPKTMPAPREDHQLQELFGRTWPTSLKQQSKPIYQHQGFCFGVLVCSELQNVGNRQCFQGDVDCVIVLSWNQDLETFSSLVESSSLDVHAYIALVNNRMYGDSRIRSPAKLPHARDLCRIRGGKNEHVVVEQLDIEGLRAFQSRSTRWPNDYDPYKPVPEDYVIAPYRKTIAR